MRALVLNLDDRPERLAFQGGQLARLGLPFDRIAATTPATVAPPMTDPYWSLWERPLRPSEAAALLSHAAAWRRVADGADPVLVLEDDAVLMPGTPAFLAALETIPGLDHVTLEVRGRRKLMARTRHPDAPMRRLWQDRTGAAAYVLWPEGARKLLARLARAPGLADGMICAAYDLSSWQADPALAVQLDICDRYGLAPPIATRSSIGHTDRAPRGPGGRRIAAQVRMGLRRLSRPFALRAEPPLATDGNACPGGHAQRSEEG